MPRILRVLRQRLRRATRGGAVDAELDRELTFHLDQLTAEFEADGLPRPEARQAARRALGNVPLLAQQCRDEQRLAWLADFRQDLAFARRTLARTPRVTFVMLASLALGIGANAAVLGVVDVVLRDPLAIADDDRVVVARTLRRDRPEQYANALIADIVAWRDRQQSFEHLAVGLGNQADFAADADGRAAERIAGQAVTAELFDVLRVQPALGRVFTASEAREAVRPLVISHRLWRERYGGDPDILDTRLRMNETSARIVAVMPEGFHYPTGRVDYWVPLVIGVADASPQRLFHVTGRLRQGFSVQQAEADLNRIARQLEQESPALHGGWSVGVAPVRRALYGWTYRPLATLAAAVALVLLVACTNVAGLLLARTMSRRQEVAVRLALGAGRARLVRQLLTESLLIAAGGAVLGVAVAWFGAQALLVVSPPLGGVAIGERDLTWRIVGLTAMLTPAAALLAGFVPAMVGSRVEVAPSGETIARTGAGGELPPRLRETLVAAQVGITFVLLIGAALLSQSFMRMVGRELHYDPSNLLTFEVHLPPAAFMQRRGSANGTPLFEIAPAAAQKFERIRAGLEQLPGARAVAGISTPLLNAIILPTAAFEGIDPLIGTAGDSSVRGRRLDAPYFVVTPRFFTAIRAPLVRGRDFSGDDVTGAPWVAIVSEEAARQLWPGRDPIGQMLRLPLVPDERPRQVVGVVRDFPLRLRQVETLPAVFTPYLQQPPRFPQQGANMFGRMTFMLRASGDATALVPAARQVVAGVDPDRPLANILPMEQHIRLTNPQGVGVALVLTLFALIATLLAGIGIYGIVSYSAARRTREIGIRMTLGAGVREITTLVSKRALICVSAGLGAGLVAALAVTQLLRSQLWGVTSTDPPTFAAALVFLLAVAVLAALLPTRKAIGLNPTVALRE